MKFRLIYCLVFFAACAPDHSGNTGTVALPDTAAIRKSIASTPVLSPAESITQMKVEDGFKVKLVAAEPLVNTPVAMTFDNKGRLWVVEMENYMPDVYGRGEEKPTGKIVILEDHNNDGVMDSRQVFLDSLVLPRALCLVENGLLVAEPPYLWYVEYRDLKPVKKTLVDSVYAVGGNPEHQPNSLTRGMDNWVYSADGYKRYMKKGNQWISEPTVSRGQWGISMDNYGRFFYNNNSQNLLGDYFTAPFGTAMNKQKIEGFNEKIVEDNRVYPSRPTPGVNRGYQKGILDDSLRLVNFTAASAPLIYRGGLFGKEEEQNAFVPEPAANLIKRNLLSENGYRVTGKQAYTGREFLSSTDERFRPVSMYNGPDGALYIVDMYRGIIQHKTFITDYLKKEVSDRSLTSPQSCGRIYKIVPIGKEDTMVDIPSDPQQLVRLLHHPNGWVRDMAQQMLVDNNDVQVAPALRDNLKKESDPLAVIHSLWALKGMNILQASDIIPLIGSQDKKLQVQALTTLPYVISKNNFRELLYAVQKLVNMNDSVTAPYTGFLIKSFRAFDPASADRMVRTLVKKYPADIFVADAILSTYNGQEQTLVNLKKEFQADSTLAIYKYTAAALDNWRSSENERTGLKKNFPKGFNLFNTVCKTCHGIDGGGISSLAPPLNRSEWVTGPPDRLISIVLYGLTGPVTINAKTYTAPEINGEMPGIGNNKEYTNEDIAQLLSFIRQSWGNSAKTIEAADIQRIRNKYPSRQLPFTTEELLKTK